MAKAEKKQIVFVVNPVSGPSGKRHILSQIERNLDLSLYDYEIVETLRPNHATEIAARAAADGVDVVCAIGGDGTVNEIAQSLVHTTTALAIIPCGSGNGLARHLHIPTDTLHAIQLINSSAVVCMDYGKVNGKPFFCTCGVGFDALVSYKFAEAGKRGALTYMESVLKNGLKYTPEVYQLDIYRGEEMETISYKAFLISCANASQYGNNAYIAPQASVHDGLMDVTIIEPFNLVDAPVMAVQLFNGTLDQNIRIKTLRCNKLVINRSHDGALHCDGEPIVAGRRVEVEIVPQALYCIAPFEEGVRELGENIQNMIVDQFTDFRLRSEQMFQENVKNQRKLVKLNKTVIDRLKKKK